MKNLQMSLIRRIGLKFKKTFWSIKSSKLHFILNERCGSKSTQNWFELQNEPYDEHDVMYVSDEIITKKPLCVIRNPIERWRSGLKHRLGKILIHRREGIRGEADYLWDEKSIYEGQVDLFINASKFYNWNRDIFLLDNLLRFDFNFIKLSSLSEVIDNPPKNSGTSTFKSFLKYCEDEENRLPNIVFDFINDLYDLSNFDLVEIKKMYSKYPIFFNESILDIFRNEMETWLSYKGKL